MIQIIIKIHVEPGTNPDSIKQTIDAILRAMTTHEISLQGWNVSSQTPNQAAIELDITDQEVQK